MNYLFFDTECANCLQGQGKVCSVGYVRTDEGFHVLKKKDILIDPDAPFLLGNARTGEGIQLGYPLSRFRNSHTFPHYYEEVKRVFTMPDQVCVGFCVYQDVGFLNYTCHRYGLPFFSFPYLDVQKLDKAFFGLKDYRGLDTLVDLFGLARFTYHRSDDDALMTMEVTARLLREIGKDLAALQADYPSVFGESTDLAKEIEERRKKKEQKRRIAQRGMELFRGTAKPSLSYHSAFFWGRKVFVHRACLYGHLDYFLQKRDLLLLKGATLVENPEEADILVYEPKTNIDRLKELKPKGIFITFHNFAKKTETGSH